MGKLFVPYQIDEEDDETQAEKVDTAVQKGYEEGGVWAAIGRGIVELFSGIGSAKKARAGRLAAQDQIDKWKALAREAADETKYLKVIRLDDASYTTYRRLFQDIHEGMQASSEQYIGEAGLVPTLNEFNTWVALP